MCSWGRVECQGHACWRNCLWQQRLHFGLHMHWKFARQECKQRGDGSKYFRFAYLVPASIAGRHSWNTLWNASLSNHSQYRPATCGFEMRINAVNLPEYLSSHLNTTMFDESLLPSHMHPQNKTSLFPWATPKSTKYQPKNDIFRLEFLTSQDPQRIKHIPLWIPHF